MSYVTKTGSVVLLNEKIHTLLSEVYCVWQVVKTPTIILNNPVFKFLNSSKSLPVAEAQKSDFNFQSLQQRFVRT